MDTDQCGFNTTLFGQGRAKESAKSAVESDIRTTGSIKQRDFMVSFSLSSSFLGCNRVSTFIFETNRMHAELALVRPDGTLQAKVMAFELAEVIEPQN
jgi:hypothetical protein